jgi:hypothetical protein
VRVAIAGILLAMVGFAIFIYSTYAMSTGDLLSSTFLLVVGVFLGMAGLFVLLSQVLPGSSVFK